MIRIISGEIGSEKYAVYAVMLNYISWFELGDLGIKKSLQNFISEQRVKKISYDNVLFSSLVISFTLSVLLFVIIFLIKEHIYSIYLTQFPFLSESNKYYLIFISSTFAILFSFSNVIYRIWYAEQKGYLANNNIMVASICSFIATFLFTKLHSTSNEKIIYFLFAYIGSNAIFTFLPLFYYVIKKRLYKNKISIPIIKMILRVGLSFSFFALSSNLVLQVDYIIMANFVPEIEITKYNVLFRIFNMAFYIYSAYLLALWPDFTENYTIKNNSFISKKIKGSIVIGIILVLTVPIFLKMNETKIISFLLPNSNIFFGSVFLILMTLYFMIRIWTDTFAIVLQSINDMKIFWLIVPLQALISITSQIILVKAMGITGIITGLCISYLTTVFWILPKRVAIKLKV